MEHRTALSTLPTSSKQGAAAATTPGTLLPAKGLYLSVLLRPIFPPPACRCCRLPLDSRLPMPIRDNLGMEVDLRWPNDLLIGPRKTGGILVEAQSEGTAVAFAVVGIGINVHQRSFDPDLSTPATSLDLEADRRIPRQPLLVSLLKSLEREIARSRGCSGRNDNSRARRVGFNMGTRQDAWKCMARRHAPV